MENSIISRDISIDAPQSMPTSGDRLSFPFETRLPIAAATGFFAGAFLGISHGAQTASLRFRAENSHRFPTTSAGWYLYHKSKNYHMLLGGIKDGLKMGTKISFWVGGFFTVEHAIDRFRGRRDFLSTAMAGLSLAGGFSAWHQFPVPTAARTAKAGLVVAMAFGLAQDMVSLARGHRLAYVDFLTGKKPGYYSTSEAD